METHEPNYPSFAVVEANIVRISKKVFLKDTSFFEKKAPQLNFPYDPIHQLVLLTI